MNDTVEIVDIVYIPSSVKDEIQEYYQNVSYERYGSPIVEGVESRASRWVETVESFVECDLINPETFLPEKGLANIKRTYLVRVLPGEVNYIYAVRSIKAAHKLNRIGN
jgi:hypothetical protein